MSTKKEQREYQRLWIAKRRAAYFADKTCVRCGTTEQLELDHVDPKLKKYNPAALWGMSETNPNRVLELSKCQVLCKKHHTEKTIAYWEQTRSHGRTLYKYGCRCDICYKAQQVHNAQRYASLG